MVFKLRKNHSDVISQNQQVRDTYASTAGLQPLAEVPLSSELCCQCVENALSLLYCILFLLFGNRQNLNTGYNRCVYKHPAVRVT